MMNKYILSLSFLLFISSCGHQIKMAERPELEKENNNQYENQTSNTLITRDSNLQNKNSQIPDTDFKKYAFELGYNPDKGLTTEETKQINQRYQVRKLERTLDSEKERRHYSKVLPYLQNDQEKMDYLSNPSIEGRQAWVIRNKIWNRAKVSKDHLDIVEAQDLTIGMTQDLVKKSWGEPETVEFSGNPIYKNEKWRYIRDVASPNGYKRERRFVFFEGGRVVGWETE